MEKNIILISCCYLLGSISGAMLATYIFKLSDPRQHGSKNPGATNMLRIGGKIPGIFTLVFDALKAVLAIAIVYHFTKNPRVQALAIAAVVVGHIFPIFFKFKGGKGVATFYASMVMLNYIGLISVFTWLSILIVTRISSLAAIISLILNLALIIFHYQHNAVILTILSLTNLLVIYRHKENILRLIQKEEKQI